jgi:hypothetical protein
VIGKFPSLPIGDCELPGRPAAAEMGLRLKCAPHKTEGDSPIAYAVTNLDFYHSLQQGLFARGMAESTST